MHYFNFKNKKGGVMAARLTDKQKKKIIADYVEIGSYRHTARKNGVCDGTVKRVVLECSDIEQKIAQKNEENTADILAYMESKRNIVCEILDKGLTALNDPEKLKNATPAQITTALGTLIDKWAMISTKPEEQANEDELSKSLKELAEKLNEDDK